MPSETAPPMSPIRRALAGLGIALLGGMLTATLITCSPPRPQLEQVLTAGVLRVATVNSPTTYFESVDGPAGFEYDWVRRFADALGVRLELVVVATPKDALKALDAGTAHLAAAGIAITPQREERYRFTEPLLTVRSEVVYRMGQPRPRDLDDLTGTLRIPRGTAHAERLAQLASDHPSLYWEEVDEQETEALLYAVAQGDLDYTIGYSNLVALYRRFYPQLRVAFAITESQPLAWAFPRGADTSLFDRAASFLAQIDPETRAALHDRYFAEVEEPLDFVSTMTLARHVESRLPRYRPYFEAAGEATGIDWRLLAAVGYQESHWNPAAVSPTGVRGLMMLTRATAEFLGVTDREDARQSIDGGARYLRRLLDQLAAVPEPDRTWQALAAYNLGLGHLLDARELTRRRGGDPDRWADVRAALPLLTQRQWHSQTRHGYARGFEAMSFVANVRTYYDMLVWITEGRIAGTEPAAVEPEAAPSPTPAPTPRVLDPLSISPPLL